MDAEKAERLFGTSQDVLELSPEDVLVDENGAPRVRPQDKTVAWVVVLYNPSCMMSRAVAPLIELAAARSVETRFAAFASVWKSTSELGYPEKYFVDLREPPRHRADAVTATASRRWPENSKPSRRRSYGDNIASMA